MVPEIKWAEGDDIKKSVSSASHKCIHVADNSFAWSWRMTLGGGCVWTVIVGDACLVVNYRTCTKEGVWGY